MKKISFILLILSITLIANAQTNPRATPTPKPPAVDNQMLACSSQNATPNERKTYLVGAGKGVTTDQRIIEKYGKLVIPRGQTERAKQLEVDHIKYKEVQLANLNSNFEEWKIRNPSPTQKEADEINNYYKTAWEYLTNNQDIKIKAAEKSWDWREKGIDVGKSIDQGEACNTCWAFVTTDVASCSLQKSRLDLADKLNFPLLSEGTFTTATKPFGVAEPVSPFVQDLLNCMPIEQEEICNLGWHGNAFDFMVYKKGIPMSYLDGALIYDEKAEKEVIYRRNYVFGQKFSCNPNRGFRKAICWNYVSSPPDKVPSVADLKKALIEHGPIAAGVVYDPCFSNYKGGIFNEKNLRDINHVVLLIGWDDKKQAWLIKNSYGENWGEKGFGWIKYGSNNIGMFAAWMDVQPRQYSSANYGD